MKLFWKVDLWKTLYFNFHYFPFKTAIRVPVFIYWQSELYKMKGQIVIDAPIRTGMVRFGPHGLGTQDLLFSRTMWAVAGTLVVKGKVYIGRGTKISIGKDARLTLGRDFKITGNTEIICQKEIAFGDGCLLSWDILMMDTDFHHITNESGVTTNSPQPIKVGNHVWIGCRNTILKGVTIPDNDVVSANSTITRSIMEENCVIGGHGKSVEVIKQGIGWFE
ncbi:MAG: acyltransferase [Bacteroidaceae bacterium]|nr:acyltransferase [Bacteroidaceae bacterium]